MPPPSIVPLKPGFRVLGSPQTVRPLGNRRRGLHPRLPFPKPLNRGFSAAFRSRVASPTCRSQSFGPSATVSGLAYPLLRLPALECLTSLANCMTLIFPLLTSAPRSGRLAAPSVPRYGTAVQISPGKFDRIPRTPPDLQTWPLMDMDFATSGPLVRPSMPPIRFLSVRPRFCSTLPSDAASRWPPLCFANPSPPSGWTGDFHSQATEHAGHTTKSLRDSLLRGRARLTGGRGNQFRGHQ